MTRPDIKIDSGKMYQCLESHVSKVGSFRAGDVLRGTHPGVAAAPIYWAETGLATDEIAALRFARGLLRPV